MYLLDVILSNIGKYRRFDTDVTNKKPDRFLEYVAK